MVHVALAWIADSGVDAEPIDLCSIAADIPHIAYISEILSPNLRRFGRI